MSDTMSAKEVEALAKACDGWRIYQGHAEHATDVSAALRSLAAQVAALTAERDEARALLGAHAERVPGPGTTEES